MKSPCMDAMVLADSGAIGMETPATLKGFSFSKALKSVDAMNELMDESISNEQSTLGLPSILNSVPGNALLFTLHSQWESRTDMPAAAAAVLRHCLDLWLLVRMWRNFARTTTEAAAVTLRTANYICEMFLFPHSPFSIPLPSTVLAELVSQLEGIHVSSNLFLPVLRAIFDAHLCPHLTALIDKDPLQSQKLFSSYARQLSKLRKKLGHRLQVADVCTDRKEVLEVLSCMMRSAQSGLFDKLAAGNVAELLRLPADTLLNECDPRGNTLLHVACMIGQTEVVDHILHVCGAQNIDRVNAKGVTALDCACKNGRMRIARLLVLHGASPSKLKKVKKGDIGSVLYRAARGSIIKQRQQLMSNDGWIKNAGASKSHRKMMNSLLWAAQTHHLNVVALLLALDCDHSELSEDTLEELRHLKSVNLSSCRLTALSRKLLLLQRLEHLSLQENNFILFDFSWLKEFKDLKVIDLSGNPLVGVDSALLPLVKVDSLHNTSQPRISTAGQRPLLLQSAAAQPTVRLGRTLPTSKLVRCNSVDSGSRRLSSPIALPTQLLALDLTLRQVKHETTNIIQNVLTGRATNTTEGHAFSHTTLTSVLCVTHTYIMPTSKFINILYQRITHEIPLSSLPPKLDGVKPKVIISSPDILPFSVDDAKDEASLALLAGIFLSHKMVLLRALNLLAKTIQRCFFEDSPAEYDMRFVVACIQGVYRHINPSRMNELQQIERISLMKAQKNTRQVDAAVASPVFAPYFDPPLSEEEADKCMLMFRSPEITAEDVAVALNFRFHLLFADVPFQEFLHSNATKRTTSPRLHAFIDASNNVGAWCASAILRCGRDVLAQLRCIEKLVEVACVLQALHAFSPLSAILSALESFPIHRLKCIMKLMSAEHTSAFLAMKMAIQQKSNFKEYRRLVSLMNPPVLPLMFPELRDLVYLEEIPTFNDGDVNTIKLFRIHEVVTFFENCRVDFCNNEDVAKLTALGIEPPTSVKRIALAMTLRVGSSVMSEVQQDEVSYLLEPRMTHADEARMCAALRLAVDLAALEEQIASMREQQNRTVEQLRQPKGHSKDAQKRGEKHGNDSKEGWSESQFEEAQSDMLAGFDLLDTMLESALSRSSLSTKKRRQNVTVRETNPTARPQASESARQTMRPNRSEVPTDILASARPLDGRTLVPDSRNPLHLLNMCKREIGALRMPRIFGRMGDKERPEKSSQGGKPDETTPEQSRRRVEASSRSGNTLPTKPSRSGSKGLRAAMTDPPPLQSSGSSGPKGLRATMTPDVSRQKKTESMDDHTSQTQTLSALEDSLSCPPCTSVSPLPSRTPGSPLRTSESTRQQSPSVPKRSDSDSSPRKRKVTGINSVGSNALHVPPPLLPCGGLAPRPMMTSSRTYTEWSTSSGEISPGPESKKTLLPEQSGIQELKNLRAMSSSARGFFRIRDVQKNEGLSYEALLSFAPSSGKEATHWSKRKERPERETM